MLPVVQICRFFDKLKGVSRYACANLTLCQLHYMYLREDMVKIVYASLEVSAIIIRDVHSCTQFVFD